MVNLLYLLTLLALGGLLVWLTAKWLLPFVLAFATAAALQRPVRWLTTKTRASRGFLSGFLIVTLVLSLAALIGGAGWWLWRTAINFFSNETALSDLATTISDLLHTVQEYLSRLSLRLSPQTGAALSTVFGDLLAESGGVLGDGLITAARGVLRFAVSRLPAMLFGFFIWVMASVFLTVDYQRVTAFIERQLPPHRRAMAADMRALCGGTLGQMLRAYFLLMVLTFGELTVGFWLLGIEGAPLIAAIIAIVDILPVLGVGTVLIPWAALSFISGSTRLAVWLLVLYLVILLVRNVVEPRLISERVGLPPIVTLICLYLGWKIAGVVGILLFPLVATVLVQLQKRGHLPLWK